MRKHFVGSAVAASLSALALLGGVGVAAAEAKGLPKDAIAVLEEIKATGKLSPEGRQTLLKYPEIAAQVADPERRTVEVSTSPAPASAAGEVGAAAISCWINDHQVTSYTVVGNVYYKYHQRADHCVDFNKSITSVHNRYPYISDSAGTAYYRGEMANVVGATPAWRVESYYQGKVENCVVEWGCISTEYPWVKLTFRADMAPGFIEVGTGIG
ncbi:hypothetical protein SAMN04488564_104314 [Lentzea waywayandensis]|uniref:Uncharacterized protein n=1 Tax=Lentzea waywayandensis TaxID=84724 RepID=A0A1I6EEP2_9PSEU|nr:hypothetical protein [Lentzea waywayandensis]SFR16165.1 hypothetical protein SAMN04488564_104314 [Lentzea waywayandensis]